MLEQIPSTPENVLSGGKYSLFLNPTKCILFIFGPVFERCVHRPDSEKQIVWPDMVVHLVCEECIDVGPRFWFFFSGA